MPRYGKDLETALASGRNQISTESVLNLGLQMVNFLEAVHESGFVYNDLKLDNILLGVG